MTSLEFFLLAGFPKLYDVFEDKENVLLVMEYCRGGELTDAISKLSQCRCVCFKHTPPTGLRGILNI